MLNHEKNLPPPPPAPRHKWLFSPKWRSKNRAAPFNTLCVRKTTGQSETAGFFSTKAGSKNRAVPFNTLCVLAFLFSAYFMIHCATPTTPAPEVSRENPKKTDPEKQEEKCQAGRGTACSKDKKCQKICDDLFSRNSHEKACLELPKETVSGFEELFETLEEEDPDDLDLDILECLLDIDDTEFANAVKKLPRAKAKAFLIEVTEDKDLARILEEEDDEFNILKQAFSRAGLGYKLRDVLTDELDDDKSFFHIVAEDENEPAYKWIDEYVEEVCEEKKDSLQCPMEKREKLGAYCKAFINHYSSELADFLRSADLFEDDYRRQLEREDEAWTASGFKNFCRDEYNVSRNSGSSSSSGSPTSSSASTGVSSSSSSGTPTTGSTTNGAPPISRELYNRICNQQGVNCGVTYDAISSLSSSSSCDLVNSDIPSALKDLFSNYGALETACIARVQHTTSACPTQTSQFSSIPAFATINLYAVDPENPDDQLYWKSDFIDSSGGTQKGNDRGSTNPEQYIVRAVHSSGTAFNVYLDKDLIPDFDSIKNHSWFYYQRTISKHHLTITHDSSYTASGVNYEKFTRTSSTITTGASVALAYQDGSGHCHYILPPSS